MEERQASSAPPLDERTMRIAVGALGVFHVFLGGWMYFFNASFFEHVGRYGVENTHYVGDVGSFTLALGIALLLAAGRPTWRGPLLYVTAIWYALHGVNHLFDIDQNEISDFRGALDTVLLAIGAVLLAWLGRVAEALRGGR
jgi:hypothetical protein